MVYEKHVFVCENKKESNGNVTGCGAFGTESCTQELKRLVNSGPLKGKVRISKSGCLGQCELGPVMVQYPEGIWHAGMTLEDIQEIFDKSILNNIEVTRLSLSTKRKSSNGS